MKIFELLDIKYESEVMHIINFPGEYCNPLYIYGPNLNEKEKYISVISECLHIKNNRLRVVSIDACLLATEYQESQMNRTSLEFYRNYRDVDCLIVENVEKLNEHVQVQDLLLEIFNILHKEKKRLVFTSNCEVSELNGVDEKLKARFCWGATISV